MANTRDSVFEKASKDFYDGITEEAKAQQFNLNSANHTACYTNAINKYKEVINKIMNWEESNPQDKEMHQIYLKACVRAAHVSQTIVSETNNEHYDSSTSKLDQSKFNEGIKSEDNKKYMNDYEKRTYEHKNLIDRELIGEDEEEETKEKVSVGDKLKKAFTSIFASDTDVLQKIENYFNEAQAAQLAALGLEKEANAATDDLKQQRQFHKAEAQMYWTALNKFREVTHKIMDHNFRDKYSEKEVRRIYLTTLIHVKNICEKIIKNINQLYTPDQTEEATEVLTKVSKSINSPENIEYRKDMTKYEKETYSRKYSAMSEQNPDKTPEKKI